MLGVIQRYADEDKAAAEKKAVEVMFFTSSFVAVPPFGVALPRQLLTSRGRYCPC